MGYQFIIIIQEKNNSKLKQNFIIKTNMVDEDKIVNYLVENKIKSRSKDVYNKVKSVFPDLDFPTFQKLVVRAITQIKKEEKSNVAELDFDNSTIDGSDNEPDLIRRVRLNEEPDQDIIFDQRYADLVQNNIMRVRNTIIRNNMYLGRGYEYTEVIRRHYRLAAEDIHHINAC